MDTPAPDDMTVPSDMIALVITAASLGVINAFARTCRRWTAFVSERANDLASARSIRSHTHTKIDLYTSHALSNGVKHGVISAEWAHTSRERRRLAVTYERGVAVMWTHTRMKFDRTTHSTTLARGHRDMMCYMLSNCDTSHVSIAADYTNGLVSISVATGKLIIMTTVPETDEYMVCTPSRPLKGYVVDGAIVPSVIKPWFDAVTAPLSDALIPLGDPVRYRAVAPAEVAEHFGKIDIIDLRVRR